LQQQKENSSSFCSTQLSLPSLYPPPFHHTTRTQNRLFSVVKYESVIHEFDPYFNYRVTQYLTSEGFYNMWDW
jgi:hypothetical protein